MNDNMKLYYTTPSTKWQDTLPIGNGSLGAMIWGSIEEELLGLNEESLWSGYYKDKNNQTAYPLLSEVRMLILNGQYTKAEQIIQDNMLGEFLESYLPLGNVILNIHKNDTDVYSRINNYTRSLDIEDSISNVSYDFDGAHYEREYFASYPHQALLIKLTCSLPVMDVSIRFDSELNHIVSYNKQTLTISGQCPEHVEPNYIKDSPNPIIQGTKGMFFQSKIQLLSSDGIVTHHELSPIDAIIKVEKATTIVFAISAVKPTRNLIQGCIKGDNNADITAIISMKHQDTLSNYNKIKKEHVTDYQAIYSKVELYLGEQFEIPTNLRLEELKNGKKDNGLFALYFQYGRYLMIASSRSGSLPANLQGIWNWEMRAPWSSNWTTNINLEMNYWPVQSCNLTECFQPFSDFLTELCEEGKKTASMNYHCRGTVLHHNTDYWKNTSPVGIVYGEDKGIDLSVSYAMWPMGGAWLTSELYKHYEYNLDKGYLKDTVYPILKETSMFLLDWLIEHNGEYVTCPSTSPENQFFTPNGDISSVGISTTMDLSIIREVFENYKKTCSILDINNEILLEIHRVLDRLAKFKIGSFGQLLEWNEEFKEPEPGHRHLSHLYGLYPSELFASDKKLIDACRTSLLYRLENGGGHTGWSCAWIINLFAILEDGENAYKYLNNLLVKSTYDNLWDAHPPFQIDGNFDGIAGIANMLVQDRNGEVKILPALPKEFKSGYVKGLRIKNNKSIDISWEDGCIIDYSIY